MSVSGVWIGSCYNCYFSGIELDECSRENVSNSTIVTGLSRR